MSLMPGAAVDTTSMRPLVASLRATFDRACSSRYSRRASSAVIDRALIPGASVRSV